LSVAQNQRYKLLSESNRVQLIPVPPRRGWIIDRNGKPNRDQPLQLRVDLIPQQLTDAPRSSAPCPKSLSCLPKKSTIRKELETSRGFQPVAVGDNIPYSMPRSWCGSKSCRGCSFTRFQPLQSRRIGGWAAGRLRRRRLAQGI
jgi:cell division protein FtsI/penicillin-binding protein 2